MNILVLAGGYSPERDVSLTSGSLIANALKRAGENVCLADVYLGVEASELDCADLFNTVEGEVYKVTQSVPDLDELKRKSGNGEALIGKGIIELCRRADVVFLALHGAMGENGQLQATLVNFGIKYTGSGYAGSLLAMDKDLAKRLFCGAGVPTPEWIIFDARTMTADDVIEAIGLPCVVKPCGCGSSVGVYLIDTKEELTVALREASAFGKVMVERKIVGRELTVGILDGEALPVVEIIPETGFYDYKNKYQGTTKEVCPAEIPDAAAEKAAQYALQGFAALQLDGYARFDFLLDDAGALWCLEANTLPGMTPTSLLPLAASTAGISYHALCEKIVELATRKQD